MPQLGSDTDSRPNPDPTLLTVVALDREVLHLRDLIDKDRAHILELIDKDRASQQKALEVALAAQDRRLNELNELRKAVEADRSQFVRVDVYVPAHEELRRQRIVDSERIVTMQSDIKAISNQWLS